MEASKRQPRRGEWIMLLDGSNTIAEVRSISRQSVYPTLWLRQHPVAGAEIPHGLVGGKQNGVYDFAILPARATHSVTFTRNVYFRGFPDSRMTRDVILLSAPLDGVVILIDFATKRKDAVLVTDISEMIEFKD